MTGTKTFTLQYQYSFIIRRRFELARSLTRWVFSLVYAWSSKRGTASKMALFCKIFINIQIYKWTNTRNHHPSEAASEVSDVFWYINQEVKRVVVTGSKMQTCQHTRRILHTIQYCRLFKTIGAKCGKSDYPLQSSCWLSDHWCIQPHTVSSSQATDQVSHNCCFITESVFS